jgi:hypothetical protein
MYPISPVISKKYQKHEVVFAKDQPEYLPLPALVLQGEEKPVLSRWRLDGYEQERIAEGADILLTQNIFSGHVCPHCGGKFDSLYNPIRLEVSDGVVE